MELLELLLSIPDLLALVFYLFKGLWWLIKGSVTLLGMGVRAVGRGCAWLLDRLRARQLRCDFPTATVVMGDRLRGRPREG